jgi:phage terminase large subunit-like protein
MIEQIKEWGELALVLVGVITVALEGLRRIYKIAKWVEEINSTTQALAKEFKPNGGATLRDQLNRVEANLEDNTRRTAELESWVKRQEDRPTL